MKYISLIILILAYLAISITFYQVAQVSPWISMKIVSILAMLFISYQFYLLIVIELKGINNISFKCRTCSYEENAYKRMDSLLNYCNNKLVVHYNPSKFPDSKPINEKFVKALREAKRDIEALMIFH